METTEIIEAIYSGNQMRSWEDTDAILRAAVRAHGDEGVGDAYRLQLKVLDEVEEMLRKQLAAAEELAPWGFTKPPNGRNADVIVAETVNETTSDRPTALRALEWAERLYPGGSYATTGVSDAAATILIELNGDILIVRYEDLDRVPRCDFCGRPL